MVLGVLAVAVVAGQSVAGPSSPRHPEAATRDLVGLSPSSAQQAGNQARFKESLASQGIPAGELVGPGDSFHELLVAITRGDGTGPPTLAAPSPSETGVALKDRQVGRSALQRERSFEVAPDRLLVVAVSTDGRARWATTVPDPTLVRAEFPDETGALSGQVLHLARGEVRVRVPADPEVTGVDIYRPSAAGSGSAPQLLGSIPVG